MFVMSDGGEKEDGEGRGEAADDKPRWCAVGKRSVHGFPLVYLLKIFFSSFNWFFKKVEINHKLH